VTKRIKTLRSRAFRAQSGRCYYCRAPMWLPENCNDFTRDHQLEDQQAHRFQCTAEHLLAPDIGIFDRMFDAAEGLDGLTWVYETPAAIVEKLNGAVNEILKSKDAQAGLARLSAEAKIGSPQDFAAFIGAEAPRWAAIANETGIKVD